MSRVLAALRREDGVALILVMIIMIVLVAVSVVLVTALVSENTNSTKSVIRQQSYQAAEAGIDAYASKLVEDGLFYFHYVAPGESTRKDSSSGVSVAAGSAWTGGSSWTYPNGHDWPSTPQLTNGYEYNLQITPPSSADCAQSLDPLCGAIMITSTGRLATDNNKADWRELQTMVRPSTVSDYYRIVDGDVAFGSSTTTNGRVYANGDIDHDGTATASLYAEGQITGGVKYQNNAKAYDKDSSPNVRSQIAQPLQFSSFLASTSTLKAVAANSGTKQVNLNGQYFDTSTVQGVVTNTQKGYPAWVLTFNSTGTFTIKACKPSSGSDTAGGSSAMSTCSASATFNVPVNGAIYSPQTIVVQGTVVGRVTVGSASDIDVGGAIAPKTAGTDVIGLLATNNLVIAQYAPSTLTWSAAVCVLNGTWETDTQDGTKSTMNFTGSAVTADGGNMQMYSARNYGYDANLLKLPPPWFPELQSYTTVFFRELPPS